VEDRVSLVSITLQPQRETYDRDDFFLDERWQRNQVQVEREVELECPCQHRSAEVYLGAPTEETRRPNEMVC
jgi:hypothetical protein